MAVNERTYVRILPESTGDRINFYHSFDIEYSGKTGTFSVGDVVIGATSLTEAVVLCDTPDNDISGAGVISTLLMEGFEAKSFTPGEDLNVNASFVAVAGANYCIYVNTTTLVGGNNPRYRQSIDAEGAAYVRFTEGAPQLDAFGKMQVSQQHKIAEYIMGYDELPNDFTDKVVGGANLTYGPFTRGVTLQCTTASGDRYTRTSDEYHVYQAGVSQLIEMTAAVGDAGKSNVDRLWGYYDDENGVYFHLSNTTFNVGLRSNSTGSVVNTSVSQSNFNLDKLDGTGISGVVLDVSKNNIYWIDLQWLGAGSIRFGVNIDGKRIVCHEMRNANVVTESYMRTASLPIRYEQINTGSTASTSEFKFFCCTIKTEGTFNPFRRAFSASSNLVSVDSISTVPLLAIRPEQQHNSIDNRSSIYPNNFSISNLSATETVVFEVVRNGTVSDGTWDSTVGESLAEINNTLTAFTGGSVRHSTIIGPGQTRTIDFKTFEDSRRGLRRGADITTYSRHIYGCRLIGDGGSPPTAANVYFTLNWDEVRD